MLPTVQLLLSPGRNIGPIARALGKSIVPLALLTFGLTTRAAAQCKVLDLQAPHWQLLFGDEFKKPKLNDTLWSRSPGSLPAQGGRYAGWGSEYFPQPGDEDYDERLLTITPGADSADASAVGVLHLTALPLPVADSIETGANYKFDVVEMPRYVKYKSAIIRSTRDSPAYGAYIMRARLPLAIEYQAWATFWLWSCTTEIDILDGAAGNRPGKISYLANAIDNVTLTTTGPTEEGCLAGPFAYPELVDYTPGTRKNAAYHKRSRRQPGFARNQSQFDAGFNTYALVWTPQKVVFYFNEIAFLSVPRSKVRTMPKWNTLIASLQMMPRASMEKSFTMDIDYIRVYQTNILKPDGKTPNYEAIVCE
ncbi:glycoside hydrolase family 16 protein [Hymenobacter chitinivorans]|uniref:Glycosyl hydrolase family 16 n=1 Tax=Hymenobacter chitinivorans DSM 11115 TaxID=1121954 RepID=A0A2M9ARU9_9BACT|nr:family 16 glycosylhydrolase [Hymenobacter chitinivorans]PJJ48409.1 glycosyl hydrolase family 16 [Hymenobacter chitinivorans DSM 11115]